MRSITVFEANDGTRFDDEARCAKHDALLVQIEIAFRPLGPKFDDAKVNFPNGHGYVQHKAEAVEKAELSLIALSREYCGDTMLDHEQRHKTDWMTVHPSWFCRLVGNDALDRAWVRLCCIDQLYREWGQPYYAEHPQDGKAVCLRG